MAELLNGVELVKKDGSKVAAEKHLEGKVVALYFSAGWCPPCRAFTPKLKEFYGKIVAEHGHDFEVIFVSRDRAAEDLVEYFNDHHGDWVYIEYGSPKIQSEELLEKFEVKTIPTLRVVKPDGTVVVADARTEVQEKGREDPEALFKAWKSLL